MVVLIIAVVCACLAVIAYVQVTVRQVEEELPLRVMGEKRAMETVARNFYEFLAVTEAARIHPTAGNLDSIREHLRVVTNDLQTMRQRYAFDTLIGASALHAVIEPAVEDIELWLDKGFGDLRPTSPVVLQLVSTRARETLSRIFDKTTEADRLAHEILLRQTNTLRQLRSQLIVPLAALGILAAGIIWLAIRQQRALKLQSEAEAATQRAQAQLRAAIDNISEGFALYDSNDALVVSNGRFRELFDGEDASIVKPGTKFETILRHAAERGLIADAQDNLETWLADRIRRHRNPAQSQVQRYSSGRWIQVSERKTDDGGTVAVYTDISLTKDREEELARKSNALEQLSNQLAKYLSPQVYDSIFLGKKEVKVASNRKKLSIFFSDIADFTETADRLESEELSQLLNHYLTEMSRIALDHGATIDKYVGDAILVFFGDPETKGVREDALACVKMAIAMRKKMDDLAEIWRDTGIEKPLRVRMGIHTGFCTVGNFGSEDRLDYTIIGGAVNTASRLESLATPGDILISYETYSQIQDQILCEKTGKTEVKGIAYPITIYKVIDLYQNLSADKRSLHFKMPHLRLDIDPGQMPSEERGDAKEALRIALERLETDRDNTVSAGDVLVNRAKNVSPQKSDRPSGKLGAVMEAIESPEGATLDELSTVTAWKPETVRKAVSRLRKQGFDIQLSKLGRRKAYRVTLSKK